MLIPRTLKKTLLVGAVGVTAGSLLFGGELVSYAKTSLHAVQREARDAVPLSFELQRARDLLDEVLPELHDNIRQIAREEVELESLARSIAESQERVAAEENALAQLRDSLVTATAAADANVNTDPQQSHAGATHQIVHRVNGRGFTRGQVTGELSRRITRLKEAKLVLEGKRRVETDRRATLAAATAALEGAQARQTQLEDRIESLDAQFRLVQATESTSGMAIDNSKLSQTEALLSDLHERLDVAQRTLAHEARFTARVPLAAPSEAQVLAQVNALLDEPDAHPAPVLVQR